MLTNKKIAFIFDKINDDLKKTFFEGMGKKNENFLRELKDTPSMYQLFPDNADKDIYTDRIQGIFNKIFYSNEYRFVIFCSKSSFFAFSGNFCKKKIYVSSYVTLVDATYAEKFDVENDDEPYSLDVFVTHSPAYIQHSISQDNKESFKMKKYRESLDNIISFIKTKVRN